MCGSEMHTLCLPNSQILGYKSMAYSIHIFLWWAKIAQKNLHDPMINWKIKLLHNPFMDTSILLLFKASHAIILLQRSLNSKV